MDRKIIFAQVLQQLMEERYKRNRSALADAVCVSPSAISQWACGRATPGLDMLVRLADELEVSLDYLAFGQEPASTTPELGHLVSHFESHTRRAEARGTSLHDLEARIGERVVAGIRSTAEELLHNPRSVGGTFDPDDVIPIERCSKHTTIVTTDLSREVLVLAEDVAAPSMFGQLIADNIRSGVQYEYIVPKESVWRETAGYLRQEVARLGELELSHVDRYLHVFYVDRACVPGFVVQHVALEKLQRRAPEILDRIVQFIYEDPQNEKLGFVAYTEPMNPGNEIFSLIAMENVPRLLKDLSVYRGMAVRS
jgi:transcriptional regulator with XRE-family HTH domain